MTAVYAFLSASGAVPLEAHRPGHDGAARLAAVLRPGDGGVLQVPGRHSLPAALRAVRRAGLEPAVMLMPGPSLADPERLVAIDREVLAYALGGAGTARDLVRTALRRLPGAQAAAYLRPVALLVQRAGHPWASPFRALVPQADPRRLLLMRAPSGDAVAAAWAPHGDGPIAHFKSGDAGVEAAALDRLGPAARRAGARIPRLLARDDSWIAMESLDGRPLAAILAGRPEQLGPAIRRVTRWLCTWHDEAARARTVTEDDLERLLLAPAGTLRAELAPGYAGWLRERFSPLVGTPLRFGPAHRDLTMANVLAGTPLAVIDWAQPDDDAPPLIDLPYTVADAIAACGRYADRPGAFERACGGTDADARAAFATAAEMPGASRLGLSLSHHACWLSHGADDRRDAGPDGPFVRIAAALSAEPERLDPFSR